MKTPNKTQLKALLKEWICALGCCQPVARWKAKGSDILGVSFSGDVETRINKIGAYYLVVTDGGGVNPGVASYNSFLDLATAIKRESRNGYPPDGWEFSLKEFNRLQDQYELLPGQVKNLVSPGDIVRLLTEERDEDIAAWLFNEYQA